MNSRCKILIVDDNTSICQMLAIMLHEHAEAVHLAFNARDALEVLRQEPIDVLFTDFQLPDGNGIELLRESRNLRPQLGLILITGFGTLESAVEAMRLGACDYITKPLHAQQVVAALHRALKSRDSQPTSARPSRLDEQETISVPLVSDLRSIQIHVVREVVRRCGGNKAAAARVLGMHRRTLYRLLEKDAPHRSIHRDDQDIACEHIDT